MDIRFLGHAAFALEHDGKTVLIDPFLTGNPKGAASADDIAADAILLTHGHGDHYGDTVAIAKRTGAPVVAITEIAGEIGEEGVEVVDCNLGGTAEFDWGSARLTPAWHTSTTPKGTVSTPAGLVIEFGDKRIYHLGDTALFSDLALPKHRGHLDVALMCIGGHYTMDRFDGGRRRRAGGRRPGDPLPLRHLPAHRDRRAGVQVRRAERRLRRGGRAPAGRDAHGMTTAVVLIEAERDAMSALGGALADLDGVAEAYSVTGEWDFVAIIRVPRHEMLADVVTGKLVKLPGVSRTQTMVAFEVFSRHDLEAMFSIGS